MAEKNIETRLNNLENTIGQQREIIRNQEKRLQKFEDIHQIQNLISRYVYTHDAGRTIELTNKVFALNDPEVSWEVAGTGYFKGKESVKKALYNKISSEQVAGNLSIHCLTTPVIEVAEDGKTAKGVWISPGAITIPDPETKQMRGYWAWTKYGCDFIKEDGIWKIWHYHVYSVFLAPSDQDFTKENGLDIFKKPDSKSTDKPKPDGPTTFDNPYNKNYVAELNPAPPEPYKTFDHTFSYGPS